MENFLSSPLSKDEESKMSGSANDIKEEIKEKREL
jgi:hypothetical protein